MFLFFCHPALLIVPNANIAKSCERFSPVVCKHPRSPRLPPCLSGLSLFQNVMDTHSSVIVPPCFLLSLCLRLRFFYLRSHLHFSKPRKPHPHSKGVCKHVSSIPIYPNRSQYQPLGVRICKRRQIAGKCPDWSKTPRAGNTVIRKA